MLGYVTLNYSPRTQPIRTLIPGRMVPIGPENNGNTGNQQGLTQVPNNTPAGDEDLQNYDSPYGMFGRDYKRIADRAKGTGNTPKDLEEPYQGPLAQAARAHNILHFNTNNLRGSRRIASPDIQSQFETGYTLPLQEFAFISDKIWNSPAGRNVAGTPMGQPSIQLPAPTSSIPTAMPWNISAPGGPY